MCSSDFFPKFMAVCNDVPGWLTPNSSSSSHLPSPYSVPCHQCTVSVICVTFVLHSHPSRSLDSLLLLSNHQILLILLPTGFYPILSSIAQLPWLSGPFYSSEFFIASWPGFLFLFCSFDPCVPWVQPLPIVREIYLKHQCDPTPSPFKILLLQNIALKCSAEGIPWFNSQLSKFIFSNSCPGIGAGIMPKCCRI